jgi:putative ABC transport system permease protein
MDLEHMDLQRHAVVGNILASIALLLGAIGLFAVIEHSVSQRTKEIGVRMAIGANTQDIRRMVLHEGMVPVAIGIIFGLTASLAVNRILQSQLVGVSPYDPVTMVGAPIVLILVSLTACLVPARRAMNVDPTVALRHE